MPASNVTHPRRDDGGQLDATFELSTVPVFDLVYHHKAGGSGSPRSVNADYNEGLELLLERLRLVNVTILGIAVDSGVARELAPEDRELALNFPIDLGETTDIQRLRLAISNAQKPIARRPDAKPGGGNSQKRIRITFTCRHTIAYSDLLDLLTNGSSETPS